MTNEGPRIVGGCKMPSFKTISQQDRAHVQALKNSSDRLLAAYRAYEAKHGRAA